MCILLGCKKSNSLTVKIYYTVGTGRQRDSAEPLDFNVIVPRSKVSVKIKACACLVYHILKRGPFSLPPNSHIIEYRMVNIMAYGILQPHILSD